MIETYIAVCSRGICIGIILKLIVELIFYVISSLLGLMIKS